MTNILWFSKNWAKLWLATSECLTKELKFNCSWSHQLLFWVVIWSWVLLSKSVKGKPRDWIQTPKCWPRLFSRYNLMKWDMQSLGTSATSWYLWSSVPEIVVWHETKTKLVREAGIVSKATNRLNRQTHHVFGSKIQWAPTNPLTCVAVSHSLWLNR